MPAAWASAAGAAIGAVGSYASAKKNAEASENANKRDPRIDSILFGSDNNGLLSQYQGLLSTPQSSAANNYSSANADYLNAYGGQDMNAIRNSSLSLMTPETAPQIGQGTALVSAWNNGSMVDAPSQNNIDLTGTFQGMLGGGNNAALRDSLKYGTDLTSAQFNKNQTDVTNNLMRNILPSLGSGAIAAGQYGGSRQGIAEGNALSDYTNQMTSANTQLGLANSANTTGQLAADYQQGQNRALSAAQGLSQQQYTKALQDANTKNQAEFTNVANAYDANKTNAAFDQQSRLANQNATLQTNQMNNASAVSGSGVLGGLLGQANGGLGAATQYAQGVNNLLTPLISGMPSQQPVYQNTAGNVMGGALMGSQLGGMFGNSGTTNFSSIRNQDNYGSLGGMFGGTPSSLSNMTGSTSSSIYGPSSGGSFDWGSMGSLFSS